MAGVASTSGSTAFAKTRARRAANSYAVVVPPAGLAVVVFIAMLSWGQGWLAAVGAFWIGGMSVLGPAGGLVATPDMGLLGYMWAMLGWLVLSCVVIAARRTRLGDLHWLILGLLVVAWTAIGLVSFLQASFSAT